MSDAAALDLDFVRSHFPPLAGDWAFFENAGGTLVPRAVIERVSAYMTETQVQPGAPYAASALAAERIAESHRLMAEMINAEPDEVAIGPSTTANVYVLAQALRPWFEPGDELIVTNLDHEANNGAWRRLEEFGVTVREWRVDGDSADLEIEALEVLLSERTRLVCFTHCSNITGSINDVARIVARVHEAGALACVDAVAYAPHRRLDVKALDVDFYLCSLYKIYGPHLALLYGKREHLRRARGQNHFFFAEDDIPQKLMPGGYNHELTAALSGITEYLDALHHHHFESPRNALHERLGEVYGLIAAHEERLARGFLEFLDSKPQVRLVGRREADRERRVPTFSMVVEGRDSGELPPLLAAHKVAIDNGDFYAARLIRDLGLKEQGGVVRASMVHYNSEADLERLIRHLDQVL
jgi:cysteine desulfurase family protein (TIGR01976 family)